MERGFRVTGEEVSLLLCTELIPVLLKPLVLLLQLFHGLLGSRQPQVTEGRARSKGTQSATQSSGGREGGNHKSELVCLHGRQ